MQKEKSPPVNLEKYLEGKKHKYMSYEEASRMYGIPYWSFVSLAKEAKATWKLRKTAMVDIVVLDKYLEEHCVITEDEDVAYERKKSVMGNRRKEVEDIDELVKAKKKKYVRYAEGAELFSMGVHTFREIAKDAGAVRRVKRCVLVNVEKVEEFIESFATEQSGDMSR